MEDLHEVFFFFSTNFLNKKTGITEVFKAGLQRVFIGWEEIDDLLAFDQNEFVAMTADELLTVIQINFVFLFQFGGHKRNKT